MADEPDDFLRYDPNFRNENFKFTGQQPPDPQWMKKAQAQSWYPIYDKLSNEQGALYEAITGKPYPGTGNLNTYNKAMAARDKSFEPKKPESHWQPGQFSSAGERYYPAAYDFAQKPPHEFLRDALSDTSITGNQFYGSNRFPNEAKRVYDTLTEQDRAGYIGEALRHRYNLDPLKMNWDEFQALSNASGNQTVGNAVSKFFPNVGSLMIDPNPEYRYYSPVGKDHFWNTNNIRKAIGLDPGIPVDQRAYDTAYDAGRFALLGRLAQKGPAGLPIGLQPGSAGKYIGYHYAPQINKAMISDKREPGTNPDVFNMVRALKDNSKHEVPNYTPYPSTWINQ